MIKLKRIYDQQENDDGFRILVDRLWPRGLPKNETKVDLWLREIAPSDKLRKWFSHDPRKWEEFQKKYRKELEARPELISKIKQIEKEKGVVTLLYAAKDQKHNNALVLSDVLKTRKP